MAAIHFLDRRGVASRAHLTAALATMEVEAILLRTRKGAILLISTMLEGCHLQCQCMIGTMASVMVLHREKGLMRSILIAPITITISSTQRHCLVCHRTLHCLLMRMQQITMVPVLGFLGQVLYRHHQNLHFPLTGITIMRRHGRPQTRRCFLSFLVLQLWQLIPLELTPCLKLTKCQMQTVLRLLTMRLLL